MRLVRDVPLLQWSTGGHLPVLVQLSFDGWNGLNLNVLQRIVV
jgi:hypothetical protein